MTESLQRENENYENANECFVLFDAQNELIVLHRNMIKHEEFVVLTNSLIDKDYPTKKHWCSIVEYHQILPHRFKIQKYLREKGDAKLFEVFFRMTIEQFFDAISQTGCYR